MTYDYTCQPKQIIDSNVNANDDVASFSITMDDSEMLECFLHHPDPNEMFSLWTTWYARLQHQQFDDFLLQHACAMHPNRFPIHDFGEVQLVCYLAQPNIKLLFLHRPYVT
jgi:hypothetical protein